MTRTDFPTAALASHNASSSRRDITTASHQKSKQLPKKSAQHQRSPLTSGCVYFLYTCGGFPSDLCESSAFPAVRAFFGSDTQAESPGRFPPCNPVSSVVTLKNACPRRSLLLRPLRHYPRNPRRPHRLHVFLLLSQIHFDQRMQFRQHIRKFRRPDVVRIHVRLRRLRQ